MTSGVRKLLTPERENLILARLDGGCCGIAELSEALGVSEATIRRDLDSLESQGKVRRVHGGALLVSAPRVELVFQEKEAHREDEKKRIAALALEIPRMRAITSTKLLQAVTFDSTLMLRRTS